MDDQEISVNALHASSIKAMSAFVRQPSAERAEMVTRLLLALVDHPERFTAPCGYNVYESALEIWSSLADHLRACARQRYRHTTH